MGSLPLLDESAPGDRNRSSNTGAQRGIFGRSDIAAADIQGDDGTTEASAESSRTAADSSDFGHPGSY